MFDITVVYRTMNPAYPATVAPGGKSIPATVRFSPAEATANETTCIIPGVDRAAQVYLCKSVKGDTVTCEILGARQASGFARKHGLDLPSLPSGDAPLVSMSISGGKDPRWTLGKGADRIQAHKSEMSAGLAGLVDFMRRAV